MCWIRSINAATLHQNAVVYYRRYSAGKFTDFDDFIFGPDSTEPDTHVYVSNEFRELVRRITQDEVGAIELCADDVRAKCVSLFDMLWISAMQIWPRPT